MKIEHCLFLRNIAMVFFALVLTAQLPAWQSNHLALQRGTLLWHARQAKLQGRTEILIAAPEIEYPELGDLDEAAGHYSVVVAEPMASKTFADSSRSIVTWYKFRVLNTLISQPSKRLPIEIPDALQEFLPLGQDEIVLGQAGGTLVLDGVTITSEERAFPQLSMKATYVLFLSIDASKHTAILAPHGVFIKTPDGHLNALVKRDNPIDSDLDRLGTKSFDRFSIEVKRRASAP